LGKGQKKTFWFLRGPDGGRVWGDRFEGPGDCSGMGAAGAGETGTMRVRGPGL